MGGLRVQDIKAHCARFRALCPHAVPDCLLRVFGNQGFEFALCPLMVEKGAARVAEEGCELGPRIRGAHVDNADGLNARARRLGIN